MSVDDSTIEVMPSLDQAEARFKKELRNLSKNELVRQASNYYMRLTLAGFKIAALEEQLTKLNASSTQKSES
jgi:hypothetical protein